MYEIARNSKKIQTYGSSRSSKVIDLGVVSIDSKAHSHWKRLLHVDLPCVSSYVSRRFCNFRQQFADRFSFSTILLNCVTFFSACFSFSMFFISLLLPYCVCTCPLLVVLYCTVFIVAPLVRINRIKIYIRCTTQRRTPLHCGGNIRTRGCQASGVDVFL